MRHFNRKQISLMMIVAAVFMMLASGSAFAMRTRIAVLPIYTENGGEVNQGKAASHYRRFMGMMNRELVQANFEVVNVFARDAAEKELNRTLQRAREDSLLVSGELCSRYGLDAVIVVKLDVKAKKVDNGAKWKAQSQVYLEGYDSAGRDLGIADDTDFLVTRDDFDRAVRDSEKELATWVARKLTAWGGNSRNSNVVHSGSSHSNSSDKAKGGLANNIRAQEAYLFMELVGANEEEITEVFGKVLNTVRGVMGTKIVGQEIIANEPQRCYTRWQVKVDRNQTDTFRLKTNMNKLINDILDAGGYIKVNGVPYRYYPHEVKMMQGFRSSRVTSQSVTFIIDRDRMRARDLSNTHDPDNTVESNDSQFD